MRKLLRSERLAVSREAFGNCIQSFSKTNLLKFLIQRWIRVEVQDFIFFLAFEAYSMENSISVLLFFIRLHLQRILGGNRTFALTQRRMNYKEIVQHLKILNHTCTHNCEVDSYNKCSIYRKEKRNIQFVSL